ncbi:MAG: DEAD/DEAH box helicase [Sandaracinaceae bacterium]|nr:DEAD/DEAH box helicase [Sandaracinaceae bacterium]
MSEVTLEEQESSACEANDSVSVPDKAAESAPLSSGSQITQLILRMSDRSVQRAVGWSALSRGKQYLRRGAVQDLSINENEARAKVVTKNEVYEPRAFVGENGALRSHCTCPSFRGPTGHCKHVAALLLAIRHRNRTARRRSDAAASESAANNGSARGSNSQNPSGKSGRRGKRRRAPENTQLASPSSAPLSTTSHSVSEKAVDPFDPWLSSADEERKPLDIEFRCTIQHNALIVTPMLAGTRSAVVASEALQASGAVPPALRPAMRVIARNLARSSQSTAELRGEEAAEFIGLVKNQRIILEPASMPLRYADEALRPKIELDRVSEHFFRVRVVFENKGGFRRFTVTHGAWFEGAPGWHIDPTEGVARPISEAVTPSWLIRLQRKPAIVCPLADLPKVLTDQVPRIAAMLSTDLPDLSNVADLIDEPLRIRLEAEGDILAARVRLCAMYGPHVFPIPSADFPPPLAFLPPKEPTAKPRIVRRDVGAEMAAVQLLRDQGFTSDENKEHLLLQGDEALRFWTRGISELPTDWEKWIPSDLRAIHIRSNRVTPSLRVSSGIDWFSLDLSFSVDGISVDENELRRALATGQKLIRLSDGSWAPIEHKEVSEILERMAEIVAGSDRSRLPLSRAGRIQDLLQIVGDRSITQEAQSLLNRLHEVGEIELLPKPRHLKVAQFREYQRVGYSWLVFLFNLGVGGILADDMGLGKTLQAIALLLWVKSKVKPHKPSLVVAPTSVVPNWAREIEKFAPSLSALIWHGAERHAFRSEIESHDVIITSYALLRRDEEVLAQIPFRYVILDEAQHIKNPLSATARAAKRLQSERRLALTGTPIENRLSEIWSIMDFVASGLLGSLKSFEENYARPIDRNDEEAIRKLKAAVRPFILRRTKSQVAPELPAKIEQEIIVPMTEEQSQLYRQILLEVRSNVLAEVEKHGIQKSQIHILAALTRLRQVACDPRLLKLSGEWSDETSGKLIALRELIAEATAGGHRILVFSQFVEMLQLIRSVLEQDGIRYEYLDGSTKDRQERVDRFNQDESIQAFLISLKAGGTGLNLTGADTVVHFDPWWNPAIEDQATDRAHRIGQNKVVTVYRLIAKGSVEEKILELSEKKRQLVANVLSSEGVGLRGLTRSDIDELFSE